MNSVYWKNSLAVVLSIFLLSACSKSPVIETGDNATVLDNTNLHKIDNTRVAAAYVDPDADFKQYTKIIIMPLSMDETRIIQPQSSRGSRSWVLEDKDKERLNSSYQLMMKKYLVDGGAYTLVTEPAADVMVISAAIVALAPSAPKDNARAGGYSARSKTFTDSAGTITMAMVLVDGGSGKRLLEWADARSGWSGLKRNTSVSNLSDVNLIFSTWANQLHRGLVALKESAVPVSSS